MNEPIIEPIEKSLILSELTEDKLLRRTNKANNLIYVVDAHNSPNVMKEIGRLREITFRAAGGGTGLACDIDEYDTMEKPCKQLIVWNPDAEEIIGGYRFILGKNITFDKNGQPRIASAHLFNFSETFNKEYLPYIIELGRSFVVPEYQSSRQGAKSLYALDNLWDGIGALIVECPDMKYMFGKFTMYPSYGTEGRDLILYFLKKYCGDKKALVSPIKPLKIETRIPFLTAKFSGLAFLIAYKRLHTELKNLGLNLPPLVSSYIGLSGTMKCFGTAINDTFGNVEETAILVTIDDIYENKRERHINTYCVELKDSIGIKSFMLG